MMVLGWAFLGNVALAAPTQLQADSLRQELLASRQPAEQKELTRQLFNHYYFLASQPDSILKYGRLLLAQTTQEAQRWRIRGILWETRQEPDSAAEAYYHALALLEADQDLVGAANIAADLGRMFQEQGAYRRSQELYRRAGRNRAAHGDSVGLAGSYVGQAGAYQRLGQLDSALYFTQLGQQIYERTQDRKGLMYVLNTLGILNIRLGRPEAARPQLERGLKLSQEMELPVDELRFRNNLANIDFDSGRPREAARQIQACIALTRQIQNPDLEKRMEGSLAEILAELGEFEAAYTHLYRYRVLGDSLAEIGFRQTLQELDARYQSSQKDLALQEARVREQEQDLEIARNENRLVLGVAIGGLVLLVLIAVLVILWQRKRSAEQLEQAKDDFFSNIVHEFRTPLSLVKAPVERIRTGQHPDTLGEDLDMLERNADRLLRLVNQLLEVAKLERREYIPARTVGSPVDFIARIAQPFQLEARERKIAFDLQLPSERPLVEFSADAVDKVVWNLLSNAFKFTPDGGQIQLGYAWTQEHFQVEVTDTGPGIPAEEQAPIFERFYRGKDAQHGGTGIGLALSRKLCRQLGGELTVESQVGKGSRFVARMQYKTVEGGTGGNTTQAGGDLIAVVEDDPDVREFIARACREAGYQVLTASNGREGFQCIQEEVPDLVISDVMMAEMDGVELTHRIKSHPLLAHIPVILLSAKSSSHHRQQGLAQGADIYLAKPFSETELLLVVRNKLATLKRAREQFEQQIQGGDSFDDKFQHADPFLQKVIQFTLTHLDQSDWTVEELARHLHLSRSQLHRKVKALAGRSTTDFVRTIRLEKGHELLSQRQGNVTEIAYATGFSSQSYFSRCFVEHFGYPPSQLIAPPT